MAEQDKPQRAYDETYLDQDVEEQGLLFDMVAQKYPDKDTYDFITAYMQSKTRRYIDKQEPYVATMSYRELWEYFLKEDAYKLKDGKAIGGFRPWWIGEFYAYYQWYYNIPSAQTIEVVPLDWLLNAYFGLIDLDLKLAVEKVGCRTD